MNEFLKFFRYLVFIVIFIYIGTEFFKIQNNEKILKTHSCNLSFKNNQHKSNSVF